MLLVVLVHCLTGCCAILNPASGHTAIIISETVIHRYGTGAMVLCWHCNQLRDQTSESLEQLAHQNLSAWMIDVIGHAIAGAQERDFCWLNYPGGRSANQVADALPEAVLRRSLGLRAEKIRSMYRESDIVPAKAAPPAY